MSHGDLCQKVHDLAEPIGTRLGLEIVEVDYVKEEGTWKLRLYLDKEGGITLDDCETMSRELSVILDQADPIPNRYQLEVSSPGAERPLKRDEDFVRFRGRFARVTTYRAVEGRKVFEGVLHGLADGKIVLEDDEGRTHLVPREMVAKARLAIRF
ncbi:MAG: ribosome maturation factor RimP [Firmicutes bacterium]|nr:ribosome maturation factor RimP [Bacillota bacterium]